MDRRKLIREIEALEREKRRRNAEEFLLRYEPRSFQWDWITTDAPIRLFIGPNQSGKTTAAAEEIVADALGHRLWIPHFYDGVKNKTYKWHNKIEIATPDEIMQFQYTRNSPPTKVAVVGLDFQTGVAGVLAPKIFEIMNYHYETNHKYIERVEKLQGKTPHKIYWRNGSVTVFFSCEQDTFRFESGTWDSIYFDEPPPQDKYLAMKRGTLVKDAQMSFTLTPLSEPWIFDTLMEDAKKEGKKVHVTTFNLYDEQVDWMTLEAKQDFEREVERQNPHNVRARIYGEFTHLLGRVIEVYEEDIHYVSEDMRPIPRIKEEAGGGTLPVTFGLTVDPHDRKPWAMAWWWVDKSGEVVFFKEWPEEPFTDIKSCDLSVSDYARLIKSIEKDFDGPVRFRYIDPNAGPKINGVTRRRLVDELAIDQLYFDYKINDALDEGHDALREYLNYTEHQQPRLYVRHECWNINHSIQRYVWKENKPGLPISEKPHEKYKDFVDVLRYTVIKQPFYLDPAALQVISPEKEHLQYL